MKYEKRIEDLIKIMKRNELDAVIIGNKSNVRYFSNLRFNAASFSLLFVSISGDVILLVAALDYNRVKKSCWIKDIRKFAEDSPNYLEPLKLVLQNRKYNRIGIEFSTITVEKEILIKETTNGQMINIENEMLELRAIKDKEEIEKIKVAARIADFAMNGAVMSIKEGMTEYEISAIAQNIIMKEGAEGLSFEPFVMIGENAWMPQRFSTSNRLKKGELALFDMGCIVDGYCSDITRTFSLGGLSDAQQQIFNIAYQAQQRAINAANPGIKSEELDREPREYITDNGYGDYFPHLTGHGLGLDVHEMPIIDKDSKILLKPGMIVTIEPGIYVEGVGACRIEDMLLITENGCELLTKTPRELYRRI